MSIYIFLFYGVIKYPFFEWGRNYPTNNPFAVLYKPYPWGTPFTYFPVNYTILDLYFPYPWGRPYSNYPSYI